MMRQVRKKHIAIAYHRTREACASNRIKIAKVDGTKNLADILTKLMPGPMLREMCYMTMYKIHVYRAESP